MAEYGTSKYGVGKYGPGGDPGSGSSVAQTSPLKINERGYVMELSQFQRRSSFSPRGVLDYGASPGETSYPSDARWHRLRNDFKAGEGQRNADTTDSEPTQYYSGYGVEFPYDRTETLKVSQTEHALTDLSFNNIYGLGLFNHNLGIVTWDGTYINVYYGPIAEGTFSTLAINDLSSNPPPPVTSDGQTLYIGGDGRILTVDTDSGGSYLPYSAAVDMIGFAKGRLIAAPKATPHKLVEVDNQGNFTTFATHWSSKMKWSNPTEAPNGIYLAGTIGDKSDVYLIDLESTDTSLRPPYQVAALPPGERINNLLYYAGMIVLSTTRGIRIATINNSGYLTYGPIVPTVDAYSPGPLTADKNFVYVAYGSLSHTGLDGASKSGAGVLQLDMREFTAPLIPITRKYTLKNGSASVTPSAIIHDGDRLYFPVDGTLHTESNGYASTEPGYLNLGVFTFGRPNDDKTISNINILGKADDSGAGSATVEVWVRADGGTAAKVASLQDATLTQHSSVTGKELEVEVKLDPGSSGWGTVELYGLQMEAIASMKFGETLVIPLILHDEVEAHGSGAVISYDVWEEYQFLKSLAASREIVDLELGDQKLKGFIQGIVQQQDSVYAWSSKGNSEFLQGIYTILFEAIS